MPDSLEPDACCVGDEDESDWRSVRKLCTSLAKVLELDVVSAVPLADDDRSDARVWRSVETCPMGSLDDVLSLPKPPPIEPWFDICARIDAMVADIIADPLASIEDVDAALLEVCSCAD